MKKTFDPSNNDLDMEISPTPNPNALKFIFNYTLKEQDKSTYRTPMECVHNPMALALFGIRGVDQIHFFKNTITITKFTHEDWEDMIHLVEEAVTKTLSDHDPSYTDPNEQTLKRQQLPKELQEIEDIVDKTIRPGLQGDGGDLQCLSYQDNILLIRYQGACGTCPSATTGTLDAIRAILQDEYNPDIEVYLAPDY